MMIGSAASPAVVKTPRRASIVAGIAALGAGVAVALALAKPGWFDRIGAALAGMNWGWAGAAIFAQIVSIGALARQQRRLLTVSGRRLPLPAVMATTYVGGAISLSLPIVGKAAAALYSYRRFTARGVRPAVVGWALAMSALHLTLAFLTIGAVGAIATGTPNAIAAGIASLAGVIAPATALLAALRVAAVRRAVDKAIDRIVDLARRVMRSRWNRVRRSLRSAVDAAATMHLTLPETVAVAGWSLLNLTATLICLALSILAVGGGVPWSLIIVVWAAAVGVGQLGLTPGGIGVVDAALTFGLVAAGLPAATAISASLVYRAISLWLAVAAGGITFLATGRSGRLVGHPHADRAGEVPVATGPPATPR